MIEADRLISAGTTLPEDVADRAIRPKLLEEYVGQPQVRSQMEIFIKAAKLRGDALDHLLIFGPPGLGKTTLANIIANEMGGRFQGISSLFGQDQARHLLRRPQRCPQRD